MTDLNLVLSMIQIHKQVAGIDFSQQEIEESFLNSQEAWAINLEYS